DGFVSVVTLTDKQWKGMVEAAGVTEDARAGTVEGRMKHGGETMREVKKHLAEMPTALVVERMTAREVPCAPVVALDELRSQPQVVASDVLHEIDHDALGRIVQPRPAASLTGMPTIGAAAPSAGEHTDEVLSEIGCSQAEIDNLRRAAVVH